MTAVVSIPFFYEAHVDAQIAPLPIDAPALFEPFLYGDHLWATTTQFVEFHGMEGLRKPSGVAKAPVIRVEAAVTVRNRA